MKSMPRTVLLLVYMAATSGLQEARGDEEATQMIYVMKHLWNGWVPAPSIVGTGRCNDGQQTGEVEVNQDTKTVVFWRVVGNADYYWIYAKKSDGTLGDINRIVANCVINHAFTLYIMGGSGTTPQWGSDGVNNLGLGGVFNGVNLGSATNVSIRANVAGTCGRIEVNTNSETGGRINLRAGYGITGLLAGKWIGSGGIIAGGDITGELQFMNSAGNIQAAGNITGQVTITNFTRNIVASNLTPENIFCQPNIDISPRCGETITWTVGGQAPVCNACLRSPADGQQDVVTWPLLAWKPASNAVRHKLYFGTTDGSPAYVDDLTEGWYEPGRLPTDTTYYWRVDELADDDTVTTGSQWSFTTTAGDPTIVRVDDNVGSPQTPYGKADSV